MNSLFGLFILQDKVLSNQGPPIGSHCIPCDSYPPLWQAGAARDIEYVCHNLHSVMVRHKASEIKVDINSIAPAILLWQMHRLSFRDPIDVSILTSSFPGKVRI